MKNVIHEAFATCECCGRPIYEDDRYVADIEGVCYFCGECAAEAAQYEDNVTRELYGDAE